MFRSWRTELTGLYGRAGVDGARASSLAVVTLAGVEGAIILSRAEGDISLYDTAVDELVRLALDTATPSGPAR